MATNCGTVTVTPAFSANSVYVSGCNLQTTSVTPGESVNVSVPVNNDNNTTASARVDLIVNGSSATSDTRNIAANGTVTFDFTFTPQSEGDYDIKTEVTSASRA